MSFLEHHVPLYPLTFVFNGQSRLSEYYYTFTYMRKKPVHRKKIIFSLFFIQLLLKPNLIAVTYTQQFFVKWTWSEDELITVVFDKNEILCFLLAYCTAVLRYKTSPTRVTYIVIAYNRQRTSQKYHLKSL
jgi:hypothetical protein